MTGNWYNGSKAVFKLHFEIANVTLKTNLTPNTVRLDDKELLDSENLARVSLVWFIKSEQNRVSELMVDKQKFLITNFDCTYLLKQSIIAI